MKPIFNVNTNAKTLPIPIMHGDNDLIAHIFGDVNVGVDGKTGFGFIGCCG